MYIQRVWIDGELRNSVKRTDEEVMQVMFNALMQVCTGYAKGTAYTLLGKPHGYTEAVGYHIELTTDRQSIIHEYTKA